MASRKILFINPKFQWTVLAWTSAFVVAPVGLFFLAHVYYFQKLQKLGQDIALPQDHVYFRFIAGINHELTMIFIACALLSLLIALLLGLIFSHRIAGPLYRLVGFFRKSQSLGETGRLSFREGDYFQEIPEAINDAVERFKKSSGR